MSQDCQEDQKNKYHLTESPDRQPRDSLDSLVFQPIFQSEPLSPRRRKTLLLVLLSEWVVGTLPQTAEKLGLLGWHGAEPPVLEGSGPP